MLVGTNRGIAFWGLILTLIMATSTVVLADDPLRLVMDGTSHHYVGEDEPGYKWDIYFRDYYNDEWRMKNVREYGSVEYYVGNRYVPSNGKRYASSASVYHSPIGDVISFASQNWQKEKSFSYNMVRHNDYRFCGCEYWIGADRWDSYYFRNAYIELVSGTFGGKTIAAGTKAAYDKNNMDNDTMMGIPEGVWRTADKEILRMRLEPERYEEIMEARETEDIE